MRARGVSAARTVNMRVEKSQDPAGTLLAPIPIAKAPYVMYPRSGKKLFATMPAGGANRGAWANRTAVFVAVGGNIYGLSNSTIFPIDTGLGTSAVLIGAVTPGSNPATMRANGLQLGVCSGGNFYIADGSGNFYQPIISFATGIVDVTGNVVNWQSGSQFTLAGANGAPISTGDLFQLGASTYTVDVVTGPTTLTLTSVPTQQGAGIAYQVGESLVFGAIIEFIDGYFIINVPNSKTFMISNLEDGTTWNALQFGTKSGSVDNIACPISIQGSLALVGDTDSTEIWSDTGGTIFDGVTTFPFQRISGTTLTIGADAAWSVAKMVDGSIIMLMNSDQGNGIIVQSNGGAPVRISNYAVENAIRQYSRTDDAIASTYVENGHSFYRIDFPSANIASQDPNAVGRSWEYDANTGVWAEIGITTSQDETYGCDLGRYHVHVTWPGNAYTAQGDVSMHLVFDYTNGNVYQVSPDFLDDNGVDFPVMRISPHINSNLEDMQCNQFALDCELGTMKPGINGPDGKPLIPTVTLFYSDDGGNTWNNAGAASLGRTGEYEGTFLRPAEQTDATPGSQTNPQVFEARPKWDNLGRFWISKTFKIKSTGKELRAVYNGLADVGPLKAGAPQAT